MLDEDVLLEHHGLALRRSKALKHVAEVRREIRPADWGDDGFHERDALHAVTMLVRPIEAECGTPVVQHKYHVVAEIQCIPEREQVIALFGVVVAVRTRRVQFVRPTHADQVGGDETAQTF